MMGMEAEIERRYVPVERYTSARATPELVGREEVLRLVEQAIGQYGQTAIIYITGAGGMGKTRLVRHILAHPPDTPGLIVAEELIDLYHTRVHSLAGFIGAMLDVLPPLADRFRAGLDQGMPDVLEVVRRAELEGFTLAEIIGRRRELTRHFLKVFNRLGAGQRVLLALDTAERLDVDDPTQRELELHHEHPFILDWLIKEFLPHAHNTAVIVAGRPGTGRVRALLERIQGVHFLPIELQGLTEEETTLYFDAVAAEARAQDDADTAERVERLDEERRRVIFHSLCDEEGGARTVRPILLALAVDHIALSEQPLPAFRAELDEAIRLTAEERQHVRDELGRAIVRAIQEEFRPADELIRHLALLPKGADVELLAHVAQVDEAEVQEAFQHIRHLSFIKVRPADERIFLHDEMYALLNKYIWERILPEHRIQVWAHVIRHYGKRVRDMQRELADLYAQLTAGARPGAPDALPGRERQRIAQRVGEIRFQLQDALVEDLYYTLMVDPRQGFQKYIRYAEEAIVAHDESLDMQLRAELWGFMASTPRPSPHVNNFTQAEVAADAAVRWVKRLVEMRRAHESAHQAIRRLRERARPRTERGALLAEMELDVWEALILAEQEEYDRAEEKLERAVHRLNELLNKSLEPMARWRLALVLARAYNNLGYVRRLQGRYYGANSAYEHALPLWRSVKLEVEQANTLNNRAFVLAELGRFSTAWQLAWDAFELRQRLGPRVPVGLSLNTLALIKIKENDLEGARTFAEQAYMLFSDLDNRHGRGLALLARAEIRRRISDWVPYIPQATASLLEEAVDYARQAVHIFREMNETDRLIEALVELGCSYRDWAKWRRDTTKPLTPGERARGRPWTKEELAEHGAQALLEAAELAASRNIRYRQVNALINLAWLRYYVELHVQALDFDAALRRLHDEVFTTVEHLIPEGYRIRRREVERTSGRIRGGLPVFDETTMIVPFLTQLGKLELLYGQIAFNRFWRSGNQDIAALREAVKHYTLSLAYDTLFSTQIFRDMRRAMGRIYDRLRTLNPKELRVVYQTVEEVEEEYGLVETRGAHRGRPAEQRRSRMYHFLRDLFGPPELLLEE
ncbi:MAG: tetratricopeptide repeat protein [Ardenticatenia bacterium]|nr:tetratricopeptide repeat protein [Ardenticatenia bacterium]